MYVWRAVLAQDAVCDLEAAVALGYNTSDVFDCLANAHLLLGGTAAAVESYNVTCVIAAVWLHFFIGPMFQPYLAFSVLGTTFTINARGTLVGCVHWLP